MKLTDRTLTVLKNFSAINGGVVLRSGTKQRTMSPDKCILVEAILEDTIPQDFGIYDLNQFLGNVLTIGSPELLFTDQSVTMTDGELALTFYSCAPNLIISPPDRELALSNVDVSFTLTNAVLTKLLKLASMNSLPNLTIIGKNGELRLQTHERNNDTSNFASVKIGDYAGDDFSNSFKTENLKLIPDDYTVELQIGRFARFKNKDNNLTYFVSFEA